jgi:hypothetical protein
MTYSHMTFRVYIHLISKENALLLTILLYIGLITPNLSKTIGSSGTIFFTFICRVMARKGVYCRCLFCHTYICTEFSLYQMGKKQELPVPLWEKTLVLLKFWKIFSPIFCIIEIISVILFIWEKNHCQMVNIHLYL